MAVTVERITGKDATLTSVDRLLEFTTRLYQTLGIESNSPDTSIQALFPPQTFESPENMLAKSIELAQKVSETWQPPDSNHHFKPNDDLMVQGLLGFGVYAVQILTEAMSNMEVGDVENIEEGILQVITRIRGAIETSDKRGNVRKRNHRTDRDDLHILFTEALNRSSKTNT